MTKASKKDSGSCLGSQRLSPNAGSAPFRRELLDRTVIWNQHQLERLVIDYIAHYDTHRRHRSLNQPPPRHTTPDYNTTDYPLPLRLIRTTRCEGFINEYKHAA